MDILITEKQLKKIIKKGEMDEQDTGPDPQPQAGTSAQQSGGQGYPEVGKWESGVTRGPANQIGITKWSDVVGASLKRDKANQLKEQVVRGKDEIKKLKQILAMDGKTLYAPTDTQIVDILDPSDFNIGGKITVRQLLSKSNGGYGNSETERWLPSSWGNVFPENSVISFMTPDGLKYEAKIRNPTLYELTKRHEFKGTKAFWDEFYSMEPQSGNWKFIGYFDDNNNQFVPLETEFTFLEKLNEWKYWILTGLSILAFLVFPEGIALYVAMGFDFVAAVMMFIEKDYIGAFLSVILAFIPFIGPKLKWWRVSAERTKILAQEIAKYDNVDDLYRYINSLEKTEKTALQTLLKENPEQLVKMIDDELLNQMSQRLTLQNAKEIVDIINAGYKNKTLKKDLVLKFFNRLYLKRFGFDFSVSLGIVSVVYGGKLTYEWLQSKYQTIKGLEIPEKTKMALDKVKKIPSEEYQNKLRPIIYEYSQKYNVKGKDGYNPDLFQEISLMILEVYEIDPNADFYEAAQFVEENYQEDQVNSKK